jgi:fumarate reductase flavoprotein subunit
VKGVFADTKGEQLLVNCRACVIAAGGFGANYEKLQKYWPEEFNNKQLFSLCPPASTGDCIDMAEEIGAAIDQTKWEPSSFPRGFMSRMPIHHPYSYTIMNIMGDGRMLSVNLDAERWHNEGAGGISSDVSVASQPDAVAYYITNDDIIDKVGPTIVDSVMDASDIPIVKNFRADIAYEVRIDEEGASGDHAKKADTLAELALKMKIDPAKFVATMERYNRFCDEGKDPDFGKDPEYLVPIRKPPFYAFFGHRFSQCTKGMNGVAVNPNFEVLDKDGEVMPGLWAAGDGCTIFGGVKRPTMFGPGGVMPGGSTVEAAPQGRMPEDTASVPNASTAGSNILSTEAVYNDGLTNAILSGYQVGINAGNYLKDL